MNNKVGAGMETAQEQRMDATTGATESAQNSARKTATPAKGKSALLSGKDAEKLDQLSNSLQKAYQETVSEDVPDSMMDLLKRLG